MVPREKRKEDERESRFYIHLEVERTIVREALLYLE